MEKMSFPVFAFLWPKSLPSSRIARDLAAAFRRTAGAKAAWEALTASHQRELIRFLDAAQTPQNRRQRIDETVGHILAPSAPPKESVKSSGRPLWKCPSCGNRFVTRNLKHSCERHTEDEVFASRPEVVHELFHHFREMVESFGPVSVIPYRNKMVFMVRVRFCGAEPKKDCLEIEFWIRRRLDSPRFRKIETLTPIIHLHFIRIREAGDLDAELAAWIRESYAVGCQDSARPAAQPSRKALRTESLGKSRFPIALRSPAPGPSRKRSAKAPRR